MEYPGEYGRSISIPSRDRTIPVRKPKGRNRISEPSLREKIISRIPDKVPKHIDEIAREAKITDRAANSIMLDPELRGLVCRLPDKYFISGS